MPAPAPAADKISRPGDSQADYELPPLSILRKNDATDGSYADDSELAKTAQRLQGTLEEFGLTSRVTGWIAGPSVTTFKISMGEGERVSQDRQSRGRHHAFAGRKVRPHLRTHPGNLPGGH